MFVSICLIVIGPFYCLDAMMVFLPQMLMSNCIMCTKFNVLLPQNR